MREKFFRRRDQIMLWTFLLFFNLLHSARASDAVFQGSCRRNSPCEHICRDVGGLTFQCSCRQGFVLLADGISCQSLLSGIHVHYGRTTQRPRYQTQKSAPRPEPSKATVPLKEFKGFGDDSFTSKTPKSAARIQNAYPVHFGSQSFMAFPVPRSMYLETNISIDFHPDPVTPGNHLIFYAGQDFGRDFISISVSRRDVILRFDCGEGTVEERYEATLGDDHWHSITITRHYCDESKIQVDKAKKVLYDNTEFKHYKGISVSKKVYLGGVPELISEEATRKSETSSNFTGCIRRLVVNDKVYFDGLIGIDLSTENHATGPCSGSKLPEPTKMPSKCADVSCYDQRTDKDTVEIQLVQEILGELDGIQHPQFSGDSFLEYSVPSDISEYLEVEIRFNATELDGLLFYTGNERGSQWMAAYLNSGFVTFNFNLGSGSIVLRSPNKVKLSVWEKLEFWRSGGGGLLKLQNQPWVEGSAPGDEGVLKTIQLTRLFLGGNPASKLPPEIHQASKQGFHGCLRKVIVNQKRLRPEKAVSFANVRECGSNPCKPNPCGPGQCTVAHDHHLCLCPFPKIGPHCEYSTAQDGMISLKGSGYLEFKQRNIMDMITGDVLDIVMHLKVDDQSYDGKQVLAFAGKESLGGDFFEIYVNKKGHLSVKLNLGSGTVRITHESSHLKDGNWHTIQVKRAGRRTTLIVDNHTPVTTATPEGSIQMNVYDAVYIGGFPPKHGMFPESGLRGCIANATIGSSFTVTKAQQASTAVNVQSCTEL